MILYFVYKNKKPVIDEKISDFEEKISEMEEQKISNQKDQKMSEVEKVNALICSAILPIVAKRKGKEHDDVHAVTESEVHPIVLNHNIKVIV